MAFKMNGWQSHSDSPNKFIGKKFRKLRKSIGAGLKASTGLIGGMFGGGGDGNNTVTPGNPGMMASSMFGSGIFGGMGNTSAQGNVDAPLVKRKQINNKKK